MKIKIDGIITDAIMISGKSQTQISKDIGISTTQLGKILRQNEMEIKYIIQIGNSIRHDFSNIIYDAISKQIKYRSLPSENMEHKNQNLELYNLRNKYLNLMEEHIILTKKFHKIIL